MGQRSDPAPRARLRTEVLRPVRRAASRAVHPAAHVAPEAVLGEGVEIAAGAVVGPEVRLGARVKVGAHAVLSGDVVVGDDTRIHPGAVLGEEPQDMGYRGEKSGVRIGARCKIREHATVHRGTGEGTVTVLEDDVLLMTHAHVGHNCRIGAGTIIAGGVLLAGHVDVAARAIVSGNSVVHQFARIGTYAMIGGASRVARDVIPFALLVGDSDVRGVNGVGVRRNAFPREDQEEIRRVFKLLFRSGLTLREALCRLDAAVTTPAGRLIREFLSAPSRRGFSGLGQLATEQR